MPANAGTSSDLEPIRAASHAGTWYSANSSELRRQLDGWLSATEPRRGPARAVISPHAGYSYSGATAAHSFKQIDSSKVDVFFVLGPSHVAALSGCALTTCRAYRTPFGDLEINIPLVRELHATGHFQWMDRDDEEAEHSIEMQLPYLAHIMQGRPFTIVPILVGSLSTSKQTSYGSLLAPYLASDRHCFVISSDFCHWGGRFRYTPLDTSRNAPPIFQQITNLDKQGMEAIASLEPRRFEEYLRRTQNTICGRNPIAVMLQAAEHFRAANNHTHSLHFLHYAQSNAARSPADSSVSYAAGALFVHPKEE